MTMHDDQALAAHLTQHGEPDHDQARDRARTVERFEQWRTAHCPDTPADDMQVLAYLLEHPTWSWSYARTVVAAINQAYQHQTGTSPSGNLVTAYLRHLAVTNGKHALPRTPALLVDVAQRIAIAVAKDQQNPDGASAAATCTARDLLTLTRQLARPDDRLTDVYKALCRAGAVRLTAGTLRATVGVRSTERTLDEQTEAGWNAHLDAIGDRPQVIANRLGHALKRTGLPADARASSLDETAWGWLWANLDPDTPRRVRNLAYLLVGLVNARRHIELARFDIGQVKPITDGHALTYKTTKNGHDHQGTVPHLSEGPDRCPPWCPACALEDLIYLVTTCHHRTSGPLFATFYGGRYRQMTRQNGRLVIRSLTKLTDGEAWGSTRSLRVGAVNSAIDAGFSLPQIAHLTGHLDLNQVEIYARRNGAQIGFFQLDLDDR